MKKLVAFIIIQSFLLLCLIAIEGVCTQGEVYSWSFNWLGVVVQLLLIVVVIGLGCLWYWSWEREASVRK